MRRRINLKNWCAALTLAVGGCAADLPKADFSNNAVRKETSQASRTEALPKSYLRALPGRNGIDMSRRNVKQIVRFGEPANDELGFGETSAGGRWGFVDAGVANGDYRVVRVWFASNRRIAVTGETVTPTIERAANRGYGYVDVSIPAEHRLGEIEQVSILRLEFNENPKRHVVVRQMALRPAEVWKSDLDREGRASDGRAILFVHGFATDFDGAARRAAQMKYDLGFAGPVIFYSWPSQGGLTGYLADRDSADSAKFHLQELLAEVSQIHGIKELIVIGHSMGGKITAEAMHLATMKNQPKALKVRDVILAAADIDREVFMQRILPAVNRTSRVTLYVSGKDLALRVSSFLNAAPRAGSGAIAASSQSGIDIIDASNVTNDFVNHSYYGDKSSILSDMFYLIRERLPASRRAGLIRVASGTQEYWAFGR